MGKSKLKGRHLVSIGFTPGRVVGIALNVLQKHYKYHTKEQKLAMMADILKNPANYEADEHLGRIANELIDKPDESPKEIPLRTLKMDYNIFGAEFIEKGAKEQMATAMQLPVTVAGALMPDAHQGYGLPIGGVLATHNAVIPYAVGVDIGCRMCLTMYDLPPTFLKGNLSKLKNNLLEHTRFGMGCEFKNPMDDAILERPEFKEIKLVKSLKDKAYRQVGTSGGGNHFVEFGLVEILEKDEDLGIEPGTYVAILSHSGSRGLGATIAGHYTKLAREKCPLPKQAAHLAWLDLNTEEGQEYWLAMNLAGDYASACHHQIHKRLAKAIGENPIRLVENHHNFAWKETLADGSQVIVHRKGATPATKGVLGIIPGSMTAPGFIVKGKGSEASINSASHGAGRLMSRRKAKQSISGSEVKKFLKKHDVTLIGGGLDEAPMAYKDINMVMGFQKNLVDILGTFQPKIVRMAAD